MSEPTQGPRTSRTLALLGLILAAFVLIVVQLRSPSSVSVAGRWTIAVFAPFFQAGAWASERLNSFAELGLSGQADALENQRLRRENAELQVRNAMLQERISKMGRERRLAQLPELGLEFRIANVIAVSQQPWVHSLTIDLGKNDGVREAMPLIDYSGGVVGMVAEAAPNHSLVLLLNDVNMSIGAIALSQSGRQQGMAQGLGKSNLLRFRPNQPQVQLEIGMRIESSGFEDSVYPKGLVIGTIVGIKDDRHGLSYADVKPAANFNSLEEVILIDTETLSRSIDLPEPEDIGDIAPPEPLSLPLPVEEPMPGPPVEIDEDGFPPAAKQQDPSFSDPDGSDGSDGSNEIGDSP